uniref:MaoC-like domain-containing protein n=1 Tax=Arundo donax TaxID=35708 RepID=A0A0A9DJV0_ARUDO
MISPVNTFCSAYSHDLTKELQDPLYLDSAFHASRFGSFVKILSDGSFCRFTRPILHGLCTLGFATRAVIKSFCNGEPTAVKSICGRFLLHVYPGETLSTEMWLDGQKVHYQTKVKERNRAVLSGYVLLKHIPSSL